MTVFLYAIKYYLGLKDNEHLSYSNLPPETATRVVYLERKQIPHK